MRVSCVLDARQLDAEPADLIVFPEGVCLGEIKKAEASHPNALIAAAIVENGWRWRGWRGPGSVRRMRGVLQHLGKNRIDYLKVTCDGRTMGTGNQDQDSVYELGDMCVVGVLICNDALETPLMRATIEKMRASAARLRVLCIPADMAAYGGFEGNRLSPSFKGVHVAFCNHTKTHGDCRRKSFITNTQGKKLKEQEREKPIGATLPLT